MPRRTARSMVLAVLVTASTIGAGAPAAADDAATLRNLLDTCSGVAVVVDPGPQSGTPTTRCVTDEAANGLAALAAAGHQFGFVPGIPGMVCTIDDHPHPCNGAPVNAYWSYWLGTDAGWSYSTRGAGFRAADSAIVEGWRFGDGTQAPRADAASVEGQPASVQPSPEPSDRGVSPSMLAGLILLGFVLATTWVRSRMIGS